MIGLLKFTHNRSEGFKKSCDELLFEIDNFAEQEALDEWYDHFEKKYSIPKETIKHQLKFYLSSQYDYVNGKFKEHLRPKNLFKSGFRHILFLFYSLLFSKKHSVGKKKYDLIIESERSNTEKYSKLVDCFGNENVLFVSNIPINDLSRNILYRTTYKKYDRQKIFLTLINELFFGSFKYLRLSIKLKINFFHITSNLVIKYLYYYSIFKFNQGNFFFETRPYFTSAIRNYLFHKFGGKISTCIQRNILPIGENGYYYDTDTFFAFGEKTADRALEYGGRIGRVVPVGSYNMEHHWFDNENRTSKGLEYDILFIGINVSMAFHFLDSYEEFMDDYYSTFEWLSMFSKKNPHLKIGIKHHVNNEIDKRELNLIKDSRIERVDGSLNTYELAMQAKSCVTYGSTMGYELIGHGVTVLYMDPGDRCVFLPKRDEEPLLDPFRSADYDEFENKITRMLKGGYIQDNAEDLSKFCMKSSDVSKNIYNWFKKEASLSLKKTNGPF